MDEKKLLQVIRILDSLEQKISEINGYMEVNRNDSHLDLIDSNLRMFNSNLERTIQALSNLYNSEPLIMTKVIPVLSRIRNLPRLEIRFKSAIKELNTTINFLRNEIQDFKKAA